jgi:large subunit ribosomal protein L29
MKVSEVRDMTIEELSTKLIDLKQEYFNLRFQHGVGQLDSTAILSKLRRDIARVKTIIKENEAKDL